MPRVTCRSRTLMAIRLVVGAGLVVGGACARERPRGPTVNAVQLLVDAGEVFPAALSMIRGARHEILFSMYLLGGIEAPPGELAGIGRELVDALVERQRAGVRVRVINTRFAAIPDPRPEAARTPNDLWFHPVFDYAASQGLAIVPPAQPNGGIDHTKYLLVDGREALFGGMNLGDAIASNHDAMVRVTGPVVATLEAVFAESWRGAAARAGVSGSSESFAAAPTAVLRGQVGDRVAAGWSRCSIDLRTTGPRGADIYPRLLEILGSLGKGDRLAVAMLLLSEPTVVDALVAAHARGASLQVLLDPNSAFYGVDCQGAPNGAAVVRLVDAGIPVRYYRVAPGQELHMKTFVATRAGGERLFGIGSANWTDSDLHHNREVYGFFGGCDDLAERLARRLDEDWLTRSMEVPAPMLARFRAPAELDALNRECTRLLTVASWGPLSRLPRETPR